MGASSSSSSLNALESSCCTFSDGVGDLMVRPVDGPTSWPSGGLRRFVSEGSTEYFSEFPESAPALKPSPSNQQQELQQQEQKEREHQEHIEQGGLKKIQEQEGENDDEEEAKDAGTVQEEVAQSEGVSDKEDEEEEDEIQLLVDRQMSLVRHCGPLGLNLKKPKHAKHWVAPVFPKTARQRNLVRNAILNNAVFLPVSADKREQIVDAFEGPIFFSKGDQVIRQGNEVPPDGPGLYLLESGTVDIFLAESGAEPPGQKVFSLEKAGQTFGELALLYDCPRTATVINTSSRDAKLWTLGFSTYCNIVDQQKVERLARNEKLLSSVSMFKVLNFNERLRIANVMQIRQCQKGDTIIKMGDSGTEFFILEEGLAHAEIRCNVVKRYTPSDYFGELALLHSPPQSRAADVVADTPASLAVLDYESVSSLFGPLSDLMAKRAKRAYRTPDQEM